MAGRPFGIYLLGIHGQRNREGPENLRMIVVTGGAGFIGSNIVAALSERGEDGIVVSDRLESEEKRENLRKHAVREVIAPEALEAFLGAHASRLRAVIHMGAITSTTETDAALLKVNNIDLSTSLWRWCGEHEIPFIYASSAATYGDGSQGFDDTLSASGLARLRPLNAYARSKHIFDRWMHRRIDCGASRPPQWVGLKFFNVYGPNEYHKGEMKSVVAKAYRVAASGGAVKLFRSHHPGYPDGGQKRGLRLCGGLRRDGPLAPRPPRGERPLQRGHGKGLHLERTDRLSLPRPWRGTAHRVRRDAGGAEGPLPVLDRSQDAESCGPRATTGSCTPWRREWTTTCGTISRPGTRTGRGGGPMGRSRRGAQSGEAHGSDEMARRSKMARFLLSIPRS